MRRLEKRIERQLPRPNKPLHSPEQDDLAPVIKPPVEPIEEIDTFLIVFFHSVVPQRPDSSKAGPEPVHGEYISLPRGVVLRGPRRRSDLSWYKFSSIPKILLALRKKS